MQEPNADWKADVVVTSFCSYVMAKEPCSREEALRIMTRLCLVTEMLLEDLPEERRKV